MTNFNGKTVWVTGASSGIGKALAQSCAAEGSNIILSGRRVKELEALAQSLPSQSLVLPFDVTNFSALEGLVAQAWDWKGQVDILINNAGISQRSLAIDTDPQVYTDLIEIDLTAPIWLTQLQLQRMSKIGGGHVVAISSVAGRIGAPMRTAYSAAKHGLIGYMDALRAEVSQTHNIQVTNILPGSVATDVSRNALTADGSKRGESDGYIEAGDDPKDCAEAIIDAVKNNTPELIFAQGMELEAAKMRHAQPEQFFGLIAQMGAQVAKEGLPK